MRNTWTRSAPVRSTSLRVDLNRVCLVDGAFALYFGSVPPLLPSINQTFAITLSQTERELMCVHHVIICIYIWKTCKTTHQWNCIRAVIACNVRSHCHSIYNTCIYSMHTYTFSLILCKIPGCMCAAVKLIRVHECTQMWMRIFIDPLSGWIVGW